MKKSSFIVFLFYVLFIAGLVLLAMGFYLGSGEFGGLIIAGAIFFCTAFLIAAIGRIFLGDNE